MTAVVLPFSCSAALRQSNGNSANINPKLQHKGFFLIVLALGFEQFVVKVFLEYIREAGQLLAFTYQLSFKLTLILLFSSPSSSQECLIVSYSTFTVHCNL